MFYQIRSAVLKESFILVVSTLIENYILLLIFFNFYDNLFQNMFMEFMEKFYKNDT